MSVIPDVVVAAIWDWIYDANIGVLNSVLHQAGVMKEKVDWLGSARLAFPAVIFVMAWRIAPLGALLIGIGMQLIPTTFLHTLSLLQERADQVESARLFEGSEFAKSGRRLRMRQITDEKSVADIWDRLRDERPIDPDHEQAIADVESIAKAKSYSNNIENFIGTAKVPMGLIGPLRVNGLHAQG